MSGSWISSGGGGNDANAFHSDTAAEISALDVVTVDGADHILIEDDSDSDNKKRILASDLLTDADAIHDNVASEISAVTEKTAPVAADLILIEDSAATNAKKRLQVGNLPITAKVEVVDSAQSEAVYATSNLSYIPLIAGNSDWIEIPFVSKLGSVLFTLHYAMSVSNGGDVDLDYQVVAPNDGDNPDAAIPSATALSSITPGTGTTRKTTTFSLTIAAGSSGYIRLTRDNADTHTGDMRLICILVTS